MDMSMFKCNLTCTGLVSNHVNFMETILLKCLQFDIFQEVRRYNQRRVSPSSAHPIRSAFRHTHVTNYTCLPAFCFSKPLRNAYKLDQTLITKPFSTNVRNRTECCFDLRVKCKNILRFQFHTCIIRKNNNLRAGGKSIQQSIQHISTDSGQTVPSSPICSWKENGNPINMYGNP